MHHRDVVGQVLDYRQVVRDEQVGEPEPVLQVEQQVDDLGLDGNVQCRNRLIAHDEFRLDSERTGNAALEESLYLAKLASKVYLIHRRDEFRGAKIYQDKLESMPDKVELVRSSVVTALHGENALTSLSVRDLKTDEIRQISVEGLFIYVGFEPATAYLPAALERDAQGFIVTDTEMRTSIPGIFAAGDVRSKLCRQVITAAGDGATAAQAAFVFLEQLHV